MKRVLLSLLILWLVVGGIAAFQRGDFADLSCSDAASTALVVALGPISYTAPETLMGTCAQPT